MATEPFAGNQDKPKVIFRPSAHKFTDPLRVFKPNDPYYYQVDNIPIEQLRDNILWLKDQVGSDASFDGVSRSDINELRPSVTGSDRAVSVSPGRFLARVNDAYGTGISTLVQDAVASILNEEVKSKVTFTLPNDVLQKLIGEVITSPIFNNGLYDHLQHHLAAPITTGTYTVDWGAFHTAFVQNDKSADGVLDIPKLKLALWKQASTVKNYSSSQVDLQQLSVEFTRRWGAPFRTSLVNVANTLSIDVPSFEDADYVNNSGFVPAARIDLLFIYTKPVDVSSTVIAKASGQAPTAITSPQLGLVKGAGVISLNSRGAGFEGNTVDPDFLNSADYTDNKDNPSNFFEATGATDGNGNTQINSTVGDTAQADVGLDNVFGSFPSPDDLMNLAPHLAEGITGLSNALIGQSVLPIAYVFVRKGQTVLDSDDIIDIRPFFRTAELAYNERAGIAGASPPLSLANPAVGKSELNRSLSQLKKFTIANQPEIPQYPRPVAGGVVFGGLNFGVEGSMLRMGADINSPFDPIADVTNLQEVTDWFKKHGGVPPSTDIIPTTPDWDIALWAQNKTGSGVHRNDRINITLGSAADQNGLHPYDHYSFSRDDEIDAAYAVRVHQTATHYGQKNGSRPGLLMAYVTKRVNFDRSLVPWMVDYDVIPQLVNCAPFTTRDSTSNFASNADQSQWASFAGTYVEKYDDHFVIVSTWQVPDPEIGSSADRQLKKYGLWAPWDNRDAVHLSGFMVTHESGRFLQPATVEANSWLETDGSIPQNNMAFSIATYPTVKFTVVGYPTTFSMNTSLGSNNNIVFST